MGWVHVADLSPAEVADLWFELFEQCTPEQQERWRQAFRSLLEVPEELARAIEEQQGARDG